MLLADDTPRKTENNIPYDIEFLDGVFTHLAIVDNPRYERANIVFNSKTVVQNYNQNQPRVPKGNPNGGQFAGTNKYINLSKKPIENFYDLHRNLAEPTPEKYTGDATFKAVLTYLGSKDGRSAIIETPTEKVIFNRNNLNHIIIDHPERLSDLNKMVRTLQAPNLIISEVKDGKDYNYYIKNFQEADKNKAQFEVVKIAPDGSFFSTSYPLRSNKFTQIINGGQIIFDLTHDTTAIQKNVSVNNIITDNCEDFNPMIKNNVQNWNEADHPRDESGKFTDKGGSSLTKSRKLLLEADINAEYKIKSKDDWIEFTVEKAKILGEKPIMGSSRILRKEDLEELDDIKIQKLKNLYLKYNILNNKEQDMTLLDELKKLIVKVENNKEQDMTEKIENEKTDKREIIRQIMAIAGKHEDNEDVRTIAKLAGELAYDKSEAGTADNECDDEEEVKNKKVKNEDEEDEKICQF